MFGIGHTELLIVLGVFVLLFGAKKIPELARGLGSGISEFKKGLSEIKDVTDEIELKAKDAAREANKEI